MIKLLATTGSKRVVVELKQPTYTSRVRMNDWDSYRNAIDEYRRDWIDHKAEWSYGCEYALMKFKLARMRELLGPKIKGFRREPQILTGEFLSDIASQNAARRKEKAPYFVRLADLYRQITELESTSGI